MSLHKCYLCASQLTRSIPSCQAVESVNNIQDALLTASANVTHFVCKHGKRGLYLDAVRYGDRQIAGRDLARTAVNAFGTVRELG